MIDYEEVVEAIWRYDIPRIDIDEDITTLYADGKPFAQVIHRADGSREDLYFEDYELQKDILIKPNATLRDVVELCAGEHPVLQLLEGEVWRRVDVYLAFLYSWRAVL